MRRGVFGSDGGAWGTTAGCLLGSGCLRDRFGGDSTRCFINGGAPPDEQVRVADLEVAQSVLDAAGHQGGGGAAGLMAVVVEDPGDLAAVGGPWWPPRGAGCWRCGGWSGESRAGRTEPCGCQRRQPLAAGSRRAGPHPVHDRDSRPARLGAGALLARQLRQAPRQQAEDPLRCRRDRSPGPGWRGRGAAGRGLGMVSFVVSFISVHRGPPAAAGGH
jgi:hypothetical protein